MIDIHRAVDADSDAAARILIEARHAAMPDVTPLRTVDELQRWVRDEVVRSKHVLLACDKEIALDFAALRTD